MTSTDVVAHLRRTRQRAAIAAAVDDLAEFRTAQEIHELLRKQGRQVGLATVYRTLQTMADLGEIDSVRTPDGQAAYRSCSAEHHHHLICRVCGRTVEITAPELEQWMKKTAAAHGFSDIDHELELFGRCSTC